MKILIASDSFKGCMSSEEANESMKRGFLKADCHLDIECFTISDGGEGMVEAFAKAYEAEFLFTQTKDLYGKPIEVKWALDRKRKIACIEAASCVGLTLYSLQSRHPMDSSSYGLGLLAKRVLNHPKVETLIIGLGGTGSNDGGMGFAGAFGMTFYDLNRRILKPSTKNLAHIAYIDKHHFYFPTSRKIIAACDVSNPLLGPKGATYVFGRQKGLSEEMQRDVETGMKNLNQKIDQTFHVDMNSLEGSGAAGGLGGMILGVFKATMVSGIDLLTQVGLFEKICKADYVFTGEGQTDAQSVDGKAVARIAHLCQKADTPLICIAGSLQKGAELLYQEGVTALFSTMDQIMTFSYAISHGSEKLQKQAYNIMRLILAAERRVKR